jgi:type II secretory pathway component PulF
MQISIADILIWFFWLLIEGALAYLVYYLFSLPLRRKERARLFLDLVEIGLRNGQSPETTVQSAAASGDLLLGVRFHMLAAWLESGLSLGEALERVPRFLPPQIVSTLRVGRELGDIRKVIRVCRQQLEDAVNKVFQGQHYLVAVLLMASPAWVAVFSVLVVFVIPRLKMIMEDMEVEFPAHLFWIGDHPHLLIGAQVVIFGVFCLGAILYFGGPGVVAWINKVVPGMADRIAYRVPWRRKRMQRDFSAMLGLLLDAGVPEQQAVQLAGESTANRVFKDRAARVVAALKSGEKLTVAVQHLDDSGDFRWRLENAAFGHGRFTEALASWQEALSARAFQLEQTAAQVVTSGLVVVNGMFVAALAFFAFSMLITVLNSPIW